MGVFRLVLKRVFFLALLILLTLSPYKEHADRKVDIKIGVIALSFSFLRA